MLKEKVILIQCMLFYIYFITDYLSNIHFASSSSKATYIVEITVRKWMLIIFRWEHEIDGALEIDMRYNNFI